MQEFFRFLLCPVIDNMNKSHSRTLNQPLANKTLVKSNYLLKVNNRNTRTRCEICSKLTLKTLVSFLLTLNIFHILL